MANKPVKKRAVSSEDQIFRSLRVGATFSRKNVPPALQTRKTVPAANAEIATKQDNGHKEEEQRSRKKRKVEKAEKAKKHRHDDADGDEDEHPLADEGGEDEAVDGTQDQPALEE